MFPRQGSLNARNITGGRARGVARRLVRSESKTTGRVTVEGKKHSLALKLKPTLKILLEKKKYFLSTERM